MRTSSSSSKSTTSLLLVWLMLASVMLPLASASDESGSEENTVIAGDLSDFDPVNDGHAYIYNDDDNPVFSAFGYLKKQWIENDYPNLIDPFSPAYQNSIYARYNCLLLRQFYVHVRSRYSKDSQMELLSSIPPET